MPSTIPAGKPTASVWNNVTASSRRPRAGAGRHVRRLIDRKPLDRQALDQRLHSKNRARGMTEHAGGPAGMIDHRREVVEFTVHVEGLVVVPAAAPATAVVGDRGHLRSQRGGQRGHGRTVVESASDEYDRHAGTGPYLPGIGNRVTERSEPATLVRHQTRSRL
jgi:hypothetical protein